MAMMASGTTGNFYDDDNAVLDDDFLNDGLRIPVYYATVSTDLEQKSNQMSPRRPLTEHP